MLKELTRRALYDLVWARPTTKVAAELGISDVALHKICKKHRVPVPGRGYWAKVAAGKPVRQALFHEVKDPDLNRVRIQGSLIHSLPSEVTEARERAKAAAEKREKKPTSGKSVPGEAHPLIERLKQRLDRAKPKSDGFIHVSGSKLFSVAVSPASTSRLLAILDQLVREAEARGYRFEPGDGALSLLVDGESISLELSEKTDKVPHQATKAESAALRRWEADRKRKQRRGEWVSEWDKPRVPEWDYVPNGLLILEIDRGRHWDRLRRRYADGRRQRLESLVDDILVAAATCAAAMKVRREECERREREWEEEEKRRREEERRATLEEKRWEFLELQMDLLEEAHRVDRFVADYTSRYPKDTLPPSCRKLIRWAQEEAQAIRASVAPEELAATLDHYRLMEDSTEIGSWVKFE